MGISRATGAFPAWVQNVGAMVDEGAEIRAICSGCRECRDVDLSKLLNFRGRCYSLIDRRCRCSLTAGCAGWIRFYFKAGVYRPLWTHAAAERWIDDARSGR